MSAPLAACCVSQGYGAPFIRSRHHPAVCRAAPPPSAAAAAAAASRAMPPLPRPRRRCAAAATSSGSGGSRPLSDDVLYGEDVPLSRLQAQLEEAVEAEEYDKAAALRDVLQRRRFDARLAVEEANERFYKAFQSGSLAAMSEVWGKGEHVQCIHPLGACIAGRQAVMDSWKAILGSARMRIILEDVRIAASDSHAFVTCVEITESGESRGRIAATNVFEKQGGQWKLVHHHGGPTPIMR